MDGGEEVVLGCAVNNDCMFMDEDAVRVACFYGLGKRWAGIGTQDKYEFGTGQS